MNAVDQPSKTCCGRSVSANACCKTCPDRNNLPIEIKLDSLIDLLADAKPRLLDTLTHIRDLLEEISGKDRIIENKEVVRGTDIVEDKASLPEHLTVNEVADYFDVSIANFYRNINKVLIVPVMKVGNRPYYLRSDVEELMKHIPAHEKGGWTFAKLKDKLSHGKL